jgi:phosphoribosyl 1,2-cyclic phosphodiesterase
MQIKILGNGGAINDGLSYNSFLIDDFFLVETPPDIMTSLFREQYDLSELRIIYLSHFHGDHYFGLPFLVLRLFFNSSGGSLSCKIGIFGPAGVKSKSEEICRLALGDNHPVNAWLIDNFTFTEISAHSEIEIDNETSLKIFPMYHILETCGFSLYRNNRIVFSYFADTVWNDKLLTQIELFPEVIIVDLNGELTDEVKIHMSEQDMIEKAIPHSEGRILFYGTHLKTQKKSSHKNIKYAYPGEIITFTV